jgi:hypothetical protein
MNGNDQAGGADSCGTVGRVMITSVEKSRLGRLHYSHPQTASQTRQDGIWTDSPLLITHNDPPSFIPRHFLPNPYADQVTGSKTLTRTGVDGLRDLNARIDNRPADSA